MRFSTIWYVRPAKAQTSLRIHAEPLIRAFAGRLNILTVKLLTDPHLSFLSLKKQAAQARVSLHLSKCQIVGNLMLRLILYVFRIFFLLCNKCKIYFDLELL